MSREHVAWLVIAILQLAVVVWTAGYIRRHSDRHGWIGGTVLVSVGALIMLASVAWVLTGGPHGRSAIPMRGGMLGFWLGLLTAAESVALGGLMFYYARSR
jgi:hypothetical protein